MANDQLSLNISLAVGAIFTGLSSLVSLAEASRIYYGMCDSLSDVLLVQFVASWTSYENTRG